MSDPRIADVVQPIARLNLKAMTQGLNQHWPEYLIEAFGLGIFMVSAGAFTTLLYAPHGWLADLPVSDLVRRALTGVAMGSTAVAIIYSPWGRRSGAHLNPSVTLAFYRLGKLSPADAVWYILFQCAGGLAGVLLTGLVLGHAFADAPVTYVVTIPGPAGPAIAALAEFAISLGLMLMVLVTSNRVRLMSYTGLLSGMLIALYVTFESPLSGMSMNPARTLASALPAQNFYAFYLYLLVPPIAMLTAVELYRLVQGHRHIACAKLAPTSHKHCIFHCDFKNHGVDLEHLLRSSNSTRTAI
jgi:aquaporin Z